MSQPSNGGIYMNKLFYPAIFHHEEDGFWVSFPDFPECLTEGDNMDHAYQMAFEALGLAITSRKEEGESIPSPSSISSINAEDGILMIINFDMMEYLRKHNSKAVKKTYKIGVGKKATKKVAKSAKK